MPLASAIRALVRAVAPGLVIQSVTRELVRPLVAALAAAVVLAGPVAVLGGPAALVAVGLWVPLAAALVLLLSRLGRLERAVEELGEGTGVHLSLTGLAASDTKVLPRLGDYAMAPGSTLCSTAWSTTPTTSGG